MAKVKEEARTKFFERVASYKKIIHDLRNEENRIQVMLKKNNDPYKHLSAVDENLTIASYNLVINSLSLSLLGVRNENHLNDAKKSCSVAIIHLESVFTDLLDVPFSEYEDVFTATESFSEMERYALIRKTGLTLALIKDSFGENTKWKWPMVDLEGRLAAVSKNALNLKTLVQGMDPRMEGYRERIGFFNLTRKQLHSAADNYRLKYEMATKRADDFRKAISYLGALQRLSILLGRQNEAMNLKRQSEIWKKKMDTDAQNREKAERTSRLTARKTTK